jgi:hypothetical protein
MMLCDIGAAGRLSRYYLSWLLISTLTLLIERRLLLLLLLYLTHLSRLMLNSALFNLSDCVLLRHSHDLILRKQPAFSYMVFYFCTFYYQL